MRKFLSPKVLLIALVLVSVLALLMPTAAFAAGSYPTMNGSYFDSTGSYQVYDMDGNLKATYKGFGLNFTGQTTNSVDGDLLLYTVASIRGTYLTGGNGVIDRISLKEGTNTVNVTTFGNHSLVLPSGVAGIATSGTATVTGSPLALAAGGTRTIPTTGPGDFSLKIYRTHTTVGTFGGLIGQDTVSRPRIQLMQTALTATATDGTGTVTGSPVTFYAGTTTLDVTGAGTVSIAVPYGMYGTATSGTATVAGSPKALPGGATTVIDTGITTGTVTITLTQTSFCNISGFMGLNDTGVSYIRGRIDGFIVTDLTNLYIYQYNESVKFVPKTLLP